MSSKLSSNEKVGLLEGELSITKRYTDGTEELVFKEQNLITTAAKQFILSGIYLPSIVSDQISTLRVGTGGTIDINGLYAAAENPAATGLVTPALTLGVTYNYDAVNVQVTFLADLDTTQCNGLMLSEAGLFKASGTIFNIKNHPGISKSSAFSIHYSWTIKVL